LATIAISATRAVKTISGNNPMILVLPEAASLTAVTGEGVLLSAGNVPEIGANPLDILGILAEDGHNDSVAGTSNIAVAIANGDTIFEANLTDSGGSGSVTAVADVGRGVALNRDTTNSILNVYFGSNANIRGRIISHSAKDDVGDTGGRVLFMFLGPYRQLDSTS